MKDSQAAPSTGGGWHLHLRRTHREVRKHTGRGSSPRAPDPGPPAPDQLRWAAPRPTGSPAAATESPPAFDPVCFLPGRLGEESTCSGTREARLGVAPASARLLGAGLRQVFLSRGYRGGSLDFKGRAPAPALDATSLLQLHSQDAGPGPVPPEPPDRRGRSRDCRPRAAPAGGRAGGRSGQPLPLRQPEPACSLCPVAVPPWLWAPWGLRKWGGLSLDCVT